MCKLILIPNATKLVNIAEFSAHMADLLADQEDGFGWAAQGKAGIFGAKTAIPESYAYPEEGRTLPVFVKNPVELIGTPSDIVGGAMFHGRISTNAPGVLNAHPLTANGWTVVHNGVVTYRGDVYKKKTQNDSEDIAHLLGVGGIKSVAANLTGYYAVGAFGPTGDMLIFRDRTAPLVYAWSERLESPVFASNDKLLEAVGQALEEDFTCYDVKEDTCITYQMGEYVRSDVFASRGFERAESQFMRKSLGFEAGRLGEYSGSHASDDPLLMNVSISYLDEIEYLDSSYTVFGDSHREITIDEFDRLPLKDKLDYSVYRWDMTLVDPWSDEYSSRKGA